MVENPRRPIIHWHQLKVSNSISKKRENAHCWFHVKYQIQKLTFSNLFFNKSRWELQNQSDDGLM